MLLRKSGRWNINQKKPCKRGKKPKLVIIKDNLRGAKRPPDWLMELQEYFAAGEDDRTDNNKTA